MNSNLPSNQSFGWTFTAVFALAALYVPAAAWAAALTGGITLWHADWLAPLNRAWMRLGEMLGQVVNPVVLGLIFFVVFTPLGLLLRLGGRDVLARRREPQRASYWVERQPPGPAPESFRNMY